MEKSELLPLLNYLLEEQEIQLQINEELLLGVEAIRQLMLERGNPDFVGAYQEKIRLLRRSERGLQIRQKAAELRRALQGIKKELS